MRAAEAASKMAKIVSYSAPATTPGTFVAAPAKAEEMYSPETFGRSRSDIVRID